MLEQCVNTNPDGNGIAYALDNKLYVNKEMEGKKFVKEVMRLQRLLPDTTMMIHSRIATGSSVDYNNCHPFAINKDSYLSSIKEVFSKYKKGFIIFILLSFLLFFILF